MQNLPSTEESLIRALRDVPTPAPATDLMARLQESSRRRRSPWIWAVPATGVSAGTVALIAVFSLKPEISLAQVAAAVDNHRQYKITNTRLLNGKGKSFKVVMERLGNAWRVNLTFGLPDKTVAIFQPSPNYTYVVVDDVTKMYPPELRVDHMLRMDLLKNVPKGQKVGIHTDRNILWQGRRVDRFRLSGMYRDGRNQTFEQEIIVDRETKLPIRMTIMRDGSAWGDIWDYNFDAPPKSEFVPQIPTDAKIYDLREQHKKTAAILSGDGPGLLVLGESGQVVVLMRLAAPERQVAAANLRISGQPGSFPGRSLLEQLKIGSPVIAAHRKIGSSDWYAYSFFNGSAKATKTLFPGATVSGSVTTGGKTEQFQDMPVLRTGDTWWFLRGFGLDLP